MIHPLNGCRAKLERAQETLDALEREASKYLSQSPPLFRLEKLHRNGGLEYEFVAYGDPNPSSWFSVVTGEIIHHMRSSLDHLIHALVVRSGEKPTYQHQFPICLTEKAFKQACERGQIKWIGATAKKLIQSVQPFTSPTPADTILFVVGHMITRTNTVC